MEDCNGVFGEYLVPQLAKLKLSHLSITLQGRVETGLFTGWFTNIESWATRISMAKELASLNLVIGSEMITDAIVGKIVDAFRRKLLQDPEAEKTLLKRSTSGDWSLDSTAVPTLESRNIVITSLQRLQIGR